MGASVLLFFLFGKPYERGFFCNDESLHHPFHASTVTSTMLYLIGLLLPICTVSHLLDFLDFLDLQNDASDDMYLINAIVFFSFFFFLAPFEVRGVS